MASYPHQSDVHPKNQGAKSKRRIAPSKRRIVIRNGPSMEHASVSREEVPAWWNAYLENTYRCQMAGYKNEKQYLWKRHLEEVDKWPENGLIKKLIRWDGLFYYFSRNRECPELKNEDIKKAFLRETIIFKNTAYTDKSLIWAPIITEQARRFNEACDEMFRTPCKTRRGKNAKNAIESNPMTSLRDFKPLSQYTIPEETKKKKNESCKKKPLKTNLNNGKLITNSSQDYDTALSKQISSDIEAMLTPSKENSMPNEVNQLFHLKHEHPELVDKSYTRQSKSKISGKTSFSSDITSKTHISVMKETKSL